MNFVAWIHTEGVIISNRYYALELAYEDIVGYKKVFFIKSPMSYFRALKENKYLHKSLEVVMCRQKYYKKYRVYHFDEVLVFLRKRYYLFRNIFSRKSFYFGYKGKSFQKDVLEKASIPCKNLENVFNVPSIANLIVQFPHVKRKQCNFHKSVNNKCACHVLDLLRAYFDSQKSIFVF